MRKKKEKKETDKKFHDDRLRYLDLGDIKDGKDGKKYIYVDVGDIRDGEDGKKYFYPKLYHSYTSSIRFKIKPDDDHRKLWSHFQNELNKIPGQPYRFHLGRKYDSIEHYKRRFEETKKPLFIIRAFLASFDAGVYPPPWVLDFVVERFRDFNKSLGKKT